MAKFLWKNEYSVGVEEIDFEHKQLLEAISELSEAIDNHSVNNKHEIVFDELESYIAHHFSTEERYFERFNYAGAKEHIASHRDFTEKIADFRTKYKNNEVEISNELIKFLEEWLRDHMLNVDRKYMECFAKNGLK